MKAQTSKLHKRVFDEIGGLERDAVRRRAEELTRDDPRRMAFLASGDCKFSNQLLLGTPIEALRLTAREFRSAVQNKFGVPQSRCLPIAGRPITNHAKNPSLRVDVYGHFLKTVTGAKYDGIRQLHDSIVNLLSRWLKRARVPHKGGAWGNPQTCKDTFSEQINRLSDNDSDDDRWRQGIIPDLIVDAHSLEHVEDGARARFGDATTLGDVKTLAPGQAYSESPSTDFGASVQKRADKVHEDYHKAAKKLDAKLGTPAGATGPVEAEMNTYNSGRVSGLAVGAFGEVSSQIRDLADLVACELSAEYLAFFDIAKKESKGIFMQRIRRSLGLAAHRGWVKLLLDRCRDLVEDPRQPRTHTHETDEDDAKAHEYFHLHQTRGRGGHYRTRQD
jgi:hypothetical protein